MTVDEKLQMVMSHCRDNPCNHCKIRMIMISPDNGTCKPFSNLTESELDDAVSLITESMSDCFIPNMARASVGLDPIKPEYYNDSKIAPIDVIEDWGLDFCLGSALKYIKRAGKKDNNPSVQDLQKVIWYVERRIKELEEATHE